ILYMGRKAVAAKLLERLCAIKDVRIAGVLTDNHLGQSVTTEVAQRYVLRIYSFTEALQAMEQGSLKFDLGVSMLYWRKLRDGFLSIPSLWTIHLPHAALPDYKGTAGYNMAILEGLEKWAVSAHYVD